MKLTVMMFAVALMLAGCKGGSNGEVVRLWGSDPKNAECIYSYDSVKGAEVSEVRGADGCKYVCASAEAGVSSEHHRLYSPNGSLRLILGGASETGGAYGWRIDYGADGKVKAVCDLGMLTDSEYGRLSKGGSYALETLRGKLTDSKCRAVYEVERNYKDEIVRVGSIEVIGGYRAEVYIKEWGPFWISDVDGGRFGFFVKLKPEGTKGGQNVELLYCNDKLIAEAAYENGKTRKVRTYNSHGQLAGTYKNCTEAPEDIAFRDYGSLIVKFF